MIKAKQKRTCTYNIWTKSDDLSHRIETNTRSFDAHYEIYVSMNAHTHTYDMHTVVCTVANACGVLRVCDAYNNTLWRKNWQSEEVEKSESERKREREKNVKVKIIEQKSQAQRFSWCTVVYVNGCTAYDSLTLTRIEYIWIKFYVHTLFFHSIYRVCVSWFWKHIKSYIYLREKQNKLTVKLPLQFPTRKSNFQFIHFISSIFEFNRGKLIVFIKIWKCFDWVRDCARDYIVIFFVFCLNSLKSR